MAVKIKTEFLICDTDAQRETLYTCPPNCMTKVFFIKKVNANGTVAVDVEIYDSSASTRYYLEYDLSVTNKSVTTFEDAYLVLQSGDRIEITANGTTPLVHCSCTVEEQFIANQGI